MSSQVKASEALRVGVIGTGGMGRRHALNLHQHIGDARVVAIYDLDTARADKVAAECGGARTFADPVRLIEDASVDAVVIASPDATHTGYTLAALERSKPVMCEKPLGLSGADALRIVEAERATGKTLVSVGFCRRFDPQHVAVREMVVAKSLGRALVYKGVHRNAEVVDGILAETVLVNSAGHDIDAARWMLGQEVKSVWVQALRAHPSTSPATRDLVLIQLGLTGDCLATIEVFVSADYGYEVTAEVVTERGSVITLQPDHALVRSKGGRGVHVPSDWLARFQAGYVAEMRAWVNAVRTGTLFPGARSEDGYQAMRVTDACIASVRSGQVQRLES